MAAAATNDATTSHSGATYPSARSGAGSSMYANLRDFLNAHQIPKDSPTSLEITHTRIPSKEHNVYGGSYHIPQEDMPEFYEHYYTAVFTKKIPEYLTEKQLSGLQGEPCGPILIDFDFRYSPEVRERMHTMETIEDLISLYAEKISLILSIPENTSVTFYVFEKPEANVSDPAITKDGIHLLIAIPMPREGQRLLRELVKEELMTVLDELPLINDADKILDEGITLGRTNWQLFGSRKPGHLPYDISHIVEFKADADGTLSPDKVVPVESVIRRQLLRLTSARTDIRNTDGVSFELTDFAKDKISRIYSGGGTNRKKPMIRLITGTPATISTIEQLQDAVREFLKGLHHEDFILNEIHEYTMALPLCFSNDYHQWIQVGIALHHSDRRLFLTWMLFSSRSDKFDFGDIPRYRSMWDHEFKEASNGLTYRSIIYWLRRENIKEYKRIHESTIDYYIERTMGSPISPKEFDFAMVLYQMFKNEYRCASVKFNTWFVFEKHRWKQVDSGNTIRYSISQDLRKTYMAKLDTYLGKTGNDDNDSNSRATGLIINRANMGSGAGGSASAAAEAAGGSVSGDDKNGQNPRVLKCIDYCSKMNETTFKNNMMKEVREIFYRKDPDFYKMVNTKRHLICFENGVIDFDKKEFRDGLPEDYITMSTGINYVKFNPENPTHIRYKNEIEEFMHQLFPHNELYEYMWNHLASTLMGSSRGQSFMIYNGAGRNGKSALVEFMGMVLGDYKGTVPITAVTQKRTGIGSASPEIAKLCGVRYAVMQEPSKGDKLNDGIMKELTGGDPIQARQLYNEPIEFVPQFKLVVCTNNLFDINTDDDGTWRRIKLIEFVSKFVDEPNKDNDYEFKIIRDMSVKFESWKEIFASLLVERAFKTNGEVPDCEMVLKASNQYRQRQNVFAEFVSDSVIKRTEADEDVPPLTMDEAWHRFKAWYQDAYSKNPPKRKELEQYLEKALGKLGVGGGRRQWNNYCLRFVME